MAGRMKSVFVKITQALFYLNVFIWLVFGIISLVWIINNHEPTSTLVAASVAIFMFGNAAAMLISGLGLGKYNKWLYILAVAVIVVNIILTFTDQFGWPDFLTLVIDVIILGLLIGIRGRYTGN
jgi:hypothetical protein